MDFDVYVPVPIDDAVRDAVCAPVENLRFGRLSIDAELAVSLGNEYLPSKRPVVDRVMAYQLEEQSDERFVRMDEVIARALAQEAELMLMDEPLTGLDVPAQQDIFEVMAALRARKVTVMIATHDLNLAAERFDRVMLLNRRLLGLGAPNLVFTPEHLMAAYGGHIHMIETTAGTMVLSDTCCEGE
jgi:ABC-type transport system involved in cytochrome bd biosynthesis fused ATPase/permease subunit